MSKFKLFYIGLILIMCFSPFVIGQEDPRLELDVPMVDPSAITLDAQMNEAAWSGAAEVNLITAAGYNIFHFPYGREGLLEPEYDEFYARLLWSEDTLYAFIHIDEIQNDSAGLWWGGQWVGDQLFVSLSNRFAVEMSDDGVTYDGNVYSAPDGPYHYLILGDQVTLNNDALTYIPEEYRGECLGDSQAVFMASDFARWAVSIDSSTGVWNLEMAIYNPHVNAQACIGFNIGGSQGHWSYDLIEGDAYAYYTWQPNIPDEPFGDPYGNGDPGFYNLNNSEYWAVLNFVDGTDRLEMDVPIVDPTVITLDAQMNEAAWSGAAEVNLITAAGYNIFHFPYGREGLLEPEYDEFYARLLWSEDTIYAFIHIDEVQNDSAGLWWGGQWVGDQLFVSLSNRFAVEMDDDGVTYDGNVYAAPDGPYHYLILGDQVTLNNEALTYVPEEYRTCFDMSDSQKVFMASDFARWAVSIDSSTGVWNLEMAIYHPNAKSQACVGFNIGGSQGHWSYDLIEGDAYAYYTWQPNVPDDPFGDPFGNGDPGFYNLNNSQYFAVLHFIDGPLDVKPEESPFGPPTAYNLLQNYPNPFNPSTTIKFEVPKQSAVYLRVYNLVGEEVATLVNGEVLGNGTYSVTFDAGSLASGIYFYELRADNVVQSRKMVLLK